MMKRAAEILVTVIVALILLAVLTRPRADDIGNSIIGTPADLGSYTTDTIVRVEFWSARRTGGAPDDWTTTRTQWESDGTSAVVRRVRLNNYLVIENTTSHTVYLAFGNAMRTEATTPTLTSTRFEERLYGEHTGKNNMVILMQSEDATRFPIYTVWALSTGEATSATLHMHGR